MHGYWGFYKFLDLLLTDCWTFLKIGASSFLVDLHFPDHWNEGSYLDAACLLVQVSPFKTVSEEMEDHLMVLNNDGIDREIREQWHTSSICLRNAYASILVIVGNKNFWYLCKSPPLRRFMEISLVLKRGTLIIVESDKASAALLGFSAAPALQKPNLILLWHGRPPYWCIAPSASSFQAAPTAVISVVQKKCNTKEIDCHRHHN